MVTVFAFDTGGNVDFFGEIFSFFKLKNKKSYKNRYFLSKIIKIDRIMITVLIQKE